MAERGLQLDMGATNRFMLEAGLVGDKYLNRHGRASFQGLDAVRAANRFTRLGGSAAQMIPGMFQGIGEQALLSVVAQETSGNLFDVHRELHYLAGNPGAVYRKIQRSNLSQAMKRGIYNSMGFSPRDADALLDNNAFAAATSKVGGALFGGQMAGLMTAGNPLMGLAAPVMGTLISDHITGAYLGPKSKGLRNYGMTYGLYEAKHLAKKDLALMRQVSNDKGVTKVLIQTMHKTNQALLALGGNKGVVWTLQQLNSTLNQLNGTLGGFVGRQVAPRTITVPGRRGGKSNPRPTKAKPQPVPQSMKWWGGKGP